MTGGRISVRPKGPVHPNTALCRATTSAFAPCLITLVPLQVQMMCWGVYRFLFGYVQLVIGAAILKTVWRLIPIVPWLLVFFCVLPRKSKVFFYILTLQASELLVIWLESSLDYMPSNQMTARLMLVAVILPLAKEAAGIPIRWVVKTREMEPQGHMMREQEHGGWLLLLFHWYHQVFQGMPRGQGPKSPDQSDHSGKKRHSQ